MTLKDADKLKKSLERMLFTGKEPDKESLYQEMNQLLGKINEK